MDLFSNVDIMHCIFLYFSITHYFYVDRRPLICDPSFIYKISYLSHVCQYLMLQSRSIIILINVLIINLLFCKMLLT